MRQPMDDVYPGSLFSSHPMPLSILALFLRSYFVPFPFTYRILLSHEIDGVRKEKERLTASMSRLFSLHTRSSYSHLLPVGTRRETTSVTREVTRRVTDMEAGWEGSFIAFATRALHAPPTSHKKSEETEWEGDMNGQPTDLWRVFPCHSPYDPIPLSFSPRSGALRAERKEGDGNVRNEYNIISFSLVIHMPFISLTLGPQPMIHS